MASLVTTGGGSGAVHALLSHPGASRFVLDARIPYSPAALAGYLGRVPDQCCSEETARKLAQTAFNHASHQANKVLGIACTAALQTTRKRKGRDRAFICIQSAHRVAVYPEVLPPASRSEQEEALSSVILNRIAAFIGEEVCRAN